MTTLQESLQSAKNLFREQVLRAVTEKPHLCYTEIGNTFGVSEDFVQRVARSFGIHRNPGRKPKGGA